MAMPIEAFGTHVPAEFDFDNFSCQPAVDFDASLFDSIEDVGIDVWEGQDPMSPSHMVDVGEFCDAEAFKAIGDLFGGEIGWPSGEPEAADAEESMEAMNTPVFMTLQPASNEDPVAAMPFHSPTPLPAAASLDDFMQIPAAASLDDFMQIPAATPLDDIMPIPAAIPLDDIMPIPAAIPLNDIMVSPAAIPLDDFMPGPAAIPLNDVMACLTSLADSKAFLATTSSAGPMPCADYTSTANSPFQAVLTWPSSQQQPQPAALNECQETLDFDQVCVDFGIVEPSVFEGLNFEHVGSYDAEVPTGHVAPDLAHENDIVNDYEEGQGLAGPCGAENQAIVAEQDQG